MNTLELTILDLLNSRDVLSYLVSHKLPVEKAWTLRKAIKKINNEIETFIEQRNSMTDIVNDKGEFSESLKSLLEIKVLIDFPEINKDDLKDLKLSSDDIGILDEKFNVSFDK